jgi:hypothetical protein
MNRSMPPGDSGGGSAASCRAPRGGRIVPGIGRLVLGTAAIATWLTVGRCCATVGPRSHVPQGVSVSAEAKELGTVKELSPDAEKPAAAETGRAKEGRS